VKYTPRNRAGLQHAHTGLCVSAVLVFVSCCGETQLIFQASTGSPCLAVVGRFLHKELPTAE